MAVDRGELQYKIAIQDQFTKPIQKFREELLKAKSTLEFVKDSGDSFRSMQRDVASATSEIRRFRSTRQSASADERAANREALQRLREISAEQKKRTTNEKLRADILKEQRKQADQTAAAERRLAKEAEAAQKRAADASRRAAAEAKELNRQLLGAGDSVNRVAFTFRRLFGILAAFAVARQVVSGFGELISSSIEFNKTIEESRIGLAGLFTAIGDVTDLAGNLQVGPDAFATALTVADDQVQKLQADALKTTATFAQLIDTFQIAVGPGLAAGLNVDQVRQVAVLVSQAASALRISQDQLSEEIRSLLTGTGTQRTSRIFTALGFTNAEIKQAREAGTLFDLLTKRLGAFGKAAEAAQNTAGGLFQRLSEAIQLSGGRAGLGFFVEFKTLLSEIGDLFVSVQRDSEGVIQKITPRPEAVQTLAILFNGLQDVVTLLKNGLQTISLTEVQNAVGLLADGLRIAARIGIGFVRGLVGGLSTVAVLAKSFIDVFNGPATSQIVELFLRLGAIAGVISLALGGVLSALRLLLAPLAIALNLFTKMLTVVEITSKVIGKIPGGLFQWTTVLAAIFFAFKGIFESILGGAVSIEDTAKLIGLSFDEAFGRITRVGEIIFKEFANILVGIFQNPIGTIAGLFNDLFGGVLAVASGLGAVVGLSDDFRAKIEEAVAVFERVQNVKPKPLFDTAKDKKELDQFVADSQKKFDELAADIATRNANNEFQAKVDIGAPEASSLASFVQSINKELEGLIGGDVIDEKAISAKLDKLQKEIETKLAGAVKPKPEATLSEFDKLIQGLITKNSNFLNFLRSGVEGFANFASSAIVDAFDPTQDVDLKERFARFLQDIAKQILQTIITLLIATAIAKAFGVPLPSDPTPPPVGAIPGLAEGGPVPGDSAVTLPRPSSIPASDTVPAWLTPGEFVQTTEAVRRYGLDVMEAIRQGLIDPTSLRALAGLGGQSNIRRSVARSGAMAFAEGGLVPAAGIQAAQATAAVGASDAQDRPTVAVVVGNEQAADRIFAGGRKAMLDFFKSNSGAINGILGKDRSR